MTVRSGFRESLTDPEVYKSLCRKFSFFNSVKVRQSSFQDMRMMEIATVKAGGFLKLLYSI